MAYGTNAYSNRYIPEGFLLMTRDLKREQEEFRNWRAQRIYDYTDEEFKTRNKNHPELPTNCYLKGFDAYESSPKYLAMIETLKTIKIRLGGSSHTLMPINVRELDGSISQHRPPSNEGIAYNLASALLKEIGEG